MLTAHDIAGDQYQKPARNTERPSPLRYSKYASDLIYYFAIHRVALASHVQWFRPDRFSTVRDARRHLQALADVDQATPWFWTDV